MSCAVPAGKTGELNEVPTGGTVQVLDYNDIATMAGFYPSATLEKMQDKIKLQMRAAASAFKEEICTNMSDWKNVKFSFEMGASAFAVAMIRGEAEFEPQEVCK